ncbi:uncharacterized protein LOC143593519 [Bidens hawaiensis]|uniref:uncharacterized protein LOC143593519 n=1 Tax=Bidens hawaiensis TaxID=980011 RepID=UPI00404AC9DE
MRLINMEQRMIRMEKMIEWLVTDRNGPIDDVPLHDTPAPPKESRPQEESGFHDVGDDASDDGSDDVGDDDASGVGDDDDDDDDRGDGDDDDFGYEDSFGDGSDGDHGL